MTSSATPKPWCLILVIWGDRYPDHHVNVLANAVRRRSESCAGVVLVTDRPREGVLPDIVQKPFPDFYRQPDMFRYGYPAKLSLFHRDVVPADMVCVYLDLDTLVLGDLGRLAALVERPDDLFMLPPASLGGFCWARRMLFRLSGGRRMATGNSSVVLFHSRAGVDLCDAYEARFAREGLQQRLMRVDDKFISWFGQDRLRGVPDDLAVMFRREFLSRIPGVARLRGMLPWVRARRAGLVAITFNDTMLKPTQFADMPSDTRLKDSRGRSGVWGDPQMSPLRPVIAEASRELGGQAVAP